MTLNRLAIAASMMSNVAGTGFSKIVYPSEAVLCGGADRRTPQWVIATLTPCFADSFCRAAQRRSFANWMFLSTSFRMSRSSVISS
jgi:hypothetical protein